MSQTIKYQSNTVELVGWNEGENGGRVLDFPTPHLHRELELILCFGGHTEAYVDAVRYELGEGDLFLSFPNQVHRFVTLEAESFQLFQVKPEMIPELAEVFRTSLPSSAVIRGGAADPAVRRLSDRLRDLSCATEESPLHRQLVHGYLLSLFSEILSRMELIGVRLNDSDALRSVVDFCSRNYTKELSLSVLEEALHLNRYYISHLFGERLGMGFNDYVNSLRISEACRLLVYSGESVTAISDRVGFNTPRTFNRAFFKHLGITPSDYRRNALNTE